MRVSIQIHVMIYKSKKVMKFCKFKPILVTTVQLLTVSESLAPLGNRPVRQAPLACKVSLNLKLKFAEVFNKAPSSVCESGDCL